MEAQIEANGSDLEAIKRIQVWIEGWKRVNGQGNHQNEKQREQNDTSIEMNDCARTRGDDSSTGRHSPERIQGSSSFSQKGLKADFNTVERIHRDRITDRRKTQRGEFLKAYDQDSSLE
jgi:hypothetical protein